MMMMIVLVMVMAKWEFHCWDDGFVSWIVFVSFELLIDLSWYSCGIAVSLDFF